MESFVHQELEKSLPFQECHWQLSHWRSEGGEIDIVAEGPDRCLALFEVKAASNVSRSDFKALNWFLRDGPGRACAERSVGFVIYLGDEILTMGPGRIALPLSVLWSYR